MIDVKFKEFLIKSIHIILNSRIIWGIDKKKEEKEKEEKKVQKEFWVKINN
jgi:hypothetical protein